MITAAFRRLRLRPLEGILLVLCLLGIVLDLTLYTGYAWADDQQDRTRRQVAAVESAITKMRRPEDLESLKKDLADAEAKLTSNPSAFPKEVDGLAITSLIANSARQTSVDIVKVETGAQTVEHFGSNDYRAHRYSVSARGQLAQVIVFINRIETGGVPTLVLNRQSYVFQNGVWNVSLDLTAYAQKE